MSRIWDYTTTPRKHLGKTDCQKIISNIGEKIKNLSEKDRLNLRIWASEEHVVLFNIPVSVVRAEILDRGLDDAHFNPWLPLNAGSSSLNGMQPNWKQKWAPFMLTLSKGKYRDMSGKEVDPNRDSPCSISLMNLFDSIESDIDTRSIADRIRQNEGTDPLDDINEE